MLMLAAKLSAVTDHHSGRLGMAHLFSKIVRVCSPSCPLWKRPPNSASNNDEAAANLSSLQFTHAPVHWDSVMDLGPRGKRNQQIDCVLSTDSDMQDASLWMHSIMSLAASQVASASGFDVQQSNSYLRQPHARHTSGHPVASFGGDFVKETTCVFLPSPAILVCSSLFSRLALLEARPPSVPVEHLAHCDALSRTMFPISAFLCLWASSSDGAAGWLRAVVSEA